jgi:hypothetical protein
LWDDIEETLKKVQGLLGSIPDDDACWDVLRRLNEYFVLVNSGERLQSGAQAGIP